ncbi:recombinase family protein [Rhodobacter capsulatus]|jgi:DNA invertase Pin-like site-specific DNA recombinase|uniref:Resolvase family protein n=1 Tax=Rhodobacter capsulatus (strain ATCC BAA-309 / NBRC 16581 / SB1003) TaxID=272942 RepID=D5AUN6_RHOCB|nr:recombinase family protein [Rhodobacter capsulatus]ADE85675.1 resolvase family protein [Rhodobacter capsulatus SB 1003]ETD01698.1 DNA invertase [Rhodobacter capsulatus DE442]ETD76766.1 DNA invertase [Rhodobacter capsulatus R121]ETE53603.1 DNA invertase [Rhodobacter capsulatus Y262]MDS0927406.1 recombinase family protein [Rhodobacter capsulatus]
MLIGYARTSTLDQKAGLDAQRRDLEAVGCERIFVEQVSSVDVVSRAQLAEALAFARDGDTLVVTKLDRLARSVAHLVGILGQLEAKGVALRILSMGIDTATPTGKLMLTILGGVAEFEREIMLERQREGIAKAKAEGKYKGRAPTARAKAEEVLRLQAEGIGGTEIAKRLGIGRASVYRILEEAKNGASDVTLPASM